MISALLKMREGVAVHVHVYRTPSMRANTNKNMHAHFSTKHSTSETQPGHVRLGKVKPLALRRTRTINPPRM